MNEEASKLWKTPQGASLLSKWLQGKPMDPADQEHLAKLKKADPPKLPQTEEPKKPT
jgi:hypothetical protein